MVATSSTGDITEEQVAFKFNNVVSETQDFNNNQYEIVFREFAEMTRFHAAGVRRGQIKSCVYISGFLFDEGLEEWIQVST